ncbi:sigma-70 family RNA polymerase sigma factor [Brevundimonas faecalis]|uniref:RNA polymerase sigma factor for flagellar operon FliA n=1 Tax=Brevundimonas faecalis TaxID=947378 RepID=A0ABV2R7J5_9CAUL
MTAEPIVPDNRLELWERWSASRDVDAREALFTAYWPFARRIADRTARTYGGGAADREDARQWAAAGLLEAIDRFDPDRGVFFEAFAARRVNGAVSDGLAGTTELRKQISTRRRMRQERLRSLAASPDPHSGSSALERLADLASDLAIGFMLEDEGLAADPEKATSLPNAYETLAWNDALRRLRTALDQLSPKERRIISLHYIEGLDFTSIAAAHGLSKGRISQLHKLALTQLRRRLLEPPSEYPSG